MLCIVQLIKWGRGYSHNKSTVGACLSFRFRDVACYLYFGMKNIRMHPRRPLRFFVRCVPLRGGVRLETRGGATKPVVLRSIRIWYSDVVLSLCKEGLIM